MNVGPPTYPPFYALTDETNGSISLAPPPVDKAAKDVGDMRSGSSTDPLAHKNYSVGSNFTKSMDSQQLRIHNPEGIISQQLKEKIFRSFYPDGPQHHPDALTEPHTDSNRSVAYRSYANWVLESDVMSDYSEDDSYDFRDPYMVTHPISHKRSRERSAGGSKGPLTQFVGQTFVENPLDDLFFLRDSDSSDYPCNEVSDYSDNEFPTISGEELEKLLEEAKGTMQFHKWQNAPVGRHQTEFRTLINLHKFAKESETRNQKRWRLREQTEKRERFETSTDNSKLTSNFH